MNTLPELREGAAPARSRVLRRTLARGVEAIDRPFDAAFGAESNPLKQLGALGWFFYWIVVATGIYLYAFFDTGITNAYQSVERLTHGQWYLGGVMRSLHRYGSDALVLVMVLHALRELVLGRYRGPRTFSWVSGIPILVFLIASGITGYWLVWDELSQYVAIASTEWLDALRVFGEPIAHNFMNSAVLSSRFFSLMAFLHIAVPLTLLLVMWIHLQRQSQARVKPPRALATWTLAAMLALALVHPAVSAPPADLDRVPAIVGLDWFYLAGYPLLDRLAPLALWAIAAAALGLLTVLPWLPFRARIEVAVVDLENCNGCGRCVADCPFNAIDLVARSDGKPFSHEAAVAANLCTGCNICMGSCPTATPFRRATALKAGIAVPSASVEKLHARSLAAAARLHGTERVLIYACAPIVNGAPAPDGAALVEVQCVGALPPPFFDFALSKKLADGVLVAGCAACDCHFRLGERWTEQRIARERDPRLRARVPRERLRAAWIGRSPRALTRAVEDFRRALADVRAVPTTAVAAHDGARA